MTYDHHVHHAQHYTGHDNHRVIHYHGEEDEEEEAREVSILYATESGNAQLNV